MEVQYNPSAKETVDLVMRYNFGIYADSLLNPTATVLLYLHFGFTSLLTYFQYR